LVNNLAAAPLFALSASIVPQTASLGDETTPGTLGFPAEAGDVEYMFNVSTQGYDQMQYYKDDPQTPGVWFPDQSINVATGFFIQKAVGNIKTTWTRDFSVN